MADETTTNDAVTQQGYVENPDHVPNETDMQGFLDTSGTAGAAHGRIQEVTPIFDVAKKMDMEMAAKALDPNDLTVDASMVVLPQGQTFTQVDPEAEKQRILDAAAAMPAVDISTSRVTPPKEEAAQSGQEAQDTAQAQTASQGVGSGQSDGGGSATPAPSGWPAATA